MLPCELRELFMCTSKCEFLRKKIFKIKARLENTAHSAEYLVSFTLFIRLCLSKRRNKNDHNSISKHGKWFEHFSLIIKMLFILTLNTFFWRNKRMVCYSRRARDKRKLRERNTEQWMAIHFSSWRNTKSLFVGTIVNSVCLLLLMVGLIIWIIIWID